MNRHAPSDYGAAPFHISTFRSGVRWIQIVMRFDPVAYAVAALRRGLYGGRLPDGAGLAAIAAPGVDLLVLAGFALVAVMVAARVCQRGARS